MCRAVTCNTCGKPTWAGCGAHVESVLGHVPPDQRCRCREKKAGERSSGGSASKGSGGLWGRLFGRSGS